MLSKNLIIFFIFSVGTFFGGSLLYFYLETKAHIDETQWEEFAESGRVLKVEKTNLNFWSSSTVDVHRCKFFGHVQGGMWIFSFS